jgi:hypothetical protein
MQPCRCSPVSRCLTFLASLQRLPRIRGDTLESLFVGAGEAGLKLTDCSTTSPLQPQGTRSHMRSTSISPSAASDQFQHSGKGWHFLMAAPSPFQDEAHAVMSLQPHSDCPDVWRSQGESPSSLGKVVRTTSDNTFGETIPRRFVAGLEKARSQGALGHRLACTIPEGDDIADFGADVGTQCAESASTGMQTAASEPPLPTRLPCFDMDACTAARAPSPGLFVSSKGGGDFARAISLGQPGSSACGTVPVSATMSVIGVRSRWLVCTPRAVAIAHALRSVPFLSARDVVIVVRCGYRDHPPSSAARRTFMAA